MNLRSLSALGGLVLIWGGLVFSRPALAQELVQAPSHFPMYELSNLKVEYGRTSSVISFDYKRTRAGDGAVEIAARTDNGYLRVSGYGSGPYSRSSEIGESGTIYLEDSRSRFGSIWAATDNAGIEFYFFVSDNNGMFPYGSSYASNRTTREFLVSNSVKQGGVNTTISPRPLKPEELAEFEKQRKAKLPPETVPQGFARCTKETVLVPGAPIKVGLAGEWRDAVFLSYVEETRKLGTSSIRYVLANTRIASRIQLAEWVAISSTTLQEIQTNPKKFSTTMRTTTGGNLVMDDDAVEITDFNQLSEGTPVQIERMMKWNDAYFLHFDGRQARVLFSELGTNKTEYMNPNLVVLKRSVLEELKKPEAKAKYKTEVASKLESVSSFGSGETASSSSGATGRSGRKSGMESGNNFRKRSKSSNSSDNLGADSSMTSSAPAESMPAEKENELRSWSDKSGKFSIDARLVRLEGSSALLRQASGKAFRVPVEKLSGEDQEYLKTFMATDENPFGNSDEPVDPASAASPVSVENLTFSRPPKEVFRLNEVTWGVNSVAASADGRLLLLGRNDQTATLWDTHANRAVVQSPRMDHMGQITACGIAPDDKHLAIAGNTGRVEVYAIGAKSKLKLVSQPSMHSEEVRCLIFSKDSTLAMTGSQDKSAVVWDVKTGALKAKIDGFDGSVEAVGLSPSGGKAYATDGKTLVIYDLSKDEVAEEVEVGKSYHSQGSAISPDCSMMAIADSYDYVIWDLEKLENLGRIQGGEMHWEAVFLPDNRHLAAGASGSVDIFDTHEGVRIRSLPTGESGYVQAINCNSTGKYIIFQSGFNSVSVCDLNPSAESESKTEAEE